MQTVDLRNGARDKLKKLNAAIDGTSILDGALAGLATYYAARAVITAQNRVGHERRLAATSKALKKHSVIVGTYLDRDGVSYVRVFVPTKRIEVILGV